MIRALWAKLVAWGWDSYELTKKDEEVYVDQAVPSMGRPYVDIEGLAFNVMPAQGGVIVQLRRYDHKSDRNNHATHIITQDEDVAEAIGKIVSLELLRA